MIEVFLDKFVVFLFVYVVDVLGFLEEDIEIIIYVLIMVFVGLLFIIMEFKICEVLVNVVMNVVVFC